MSKSYNFKTPILTSLLLAIGVTTGLVFYSTSKMTYAPKPKEDFAATEVEKVSEEETNYEIMSPDGKFSLKLNNKGSDLIHQTVILKNEKDGVENVLLEKASSNDSLFSLPFNSFSPDDKYIFLKEGEGESAKYLVLRTDSKKLKGDIQTAEIVSLFEAKYSDFKVTDVTGWGGEYVIVVNTDYKNGKVGPSFWFEPASLGFIRLNTRFN